MVEMRPILGLASAWLGLFTYRSYLSSTSHMSYTSYWSYSPTAATGGRQRKDEFPPFLRHVGRPGNN